MKKFIYILISMLCVNVVIAQPYNLYQPNKYKYDDLGNIDEKVMFVMDFSSSMNETTEKKRKVDLILEAMSQILPSINKKTEVGLRVYGHKVGFTPYDACRASSLLVPVSQGSAEQIETRLGKTTPKGMTPITYSLKKTVNSDFLGFSGKKHIILLTDGGENCDESPCIWAMEFIKTRKDVKIDVIAFNVNNKEDLDQLQCTALVTTGKFYSAKTSAELADSLKKSLAPKNRVGAKIIPNP